MNGEKFKDARCSIYYKPSVATEIAEGLDLSKLPDEYKKVTIEPNKTNIREALENGIEIEGCRLVENVSIVVR